MSAPRRIAACLLLLLGACGGVDTGSDAERRAAEEARGEELVAQASHAYAAEAFARAFALSDPLTAPAADRARLAFRAGRALAAEALRAHAASTATPRGERFAWAALVWLDEAEALDTGLLAAIEPRARLIESGVFGEAKPERAQHLRQRFVEGVAARGGPEKALATPAERAAYEEAVARVK